MMNQYSVLCTTRTDQYYEENNDIFKIIHTSKNGVTPKGSLH